MPPTDPADSWGGPVQWLTFPCSHILPRGAPKKARAALGVLILGQLGLHLLFGDETFLYSLHWLPLLVVLAALPTLTRARIWARGCALALIVCAGVNNSAQLSLAVDRVRGYPALEASEEPERPLTWVLRPGVARGRPAKVERRRLGCDFKAEPEERSPVRDSPIAFGSGPGRFATTEWMRVPRSGSRER